MFLSVTLFWMSGFDYNLMDVASPMILQLAYMIFVGVSKLEHINYKDMRTEIFVFQVKSKSTQLM